MILNPILDCMEQLLEDGCELGPLVVTWKTAGISHIPRLVEVACGADGELGTLASVREAIAGMLRVLHAICIAGERADVSLQVINSLLHALSTAATPIALVMLTRKG